MKKLILTTWIAVASIAATSTASASTLLDWGMETFDSATNLAWLDLSITNGLSVDASMATYTDYRVATLDEVITLFGNAGVPSPNQNNIVGASAATALIDLLGVTFSVDNQFGTQGLALGTGGVNYTDPFVTVTNGTEGRTYRGLFDPGWLPSTFSGNGVGTYLVRTADPVSEVPLPASGVLLLAGLAGGFGLKRFQKRKSEV